METVLRIETKSHIFLYKKFYLKKSIRDKPRGRSLFGHAPLKPL